MISKRMSEDVAAAFLCLVRSFESFLSGLLSLLLSFISSFTLPTPAQLIYVTNWAWQQFERRA